jgi:hypothetical protein
MLWVCKGVFGGSLFEGRIVCLDSGGALGTRLGRAHSLIRIEIPGNLIQKLHDHTHKTSARGSKCAVPEVASGEVDTRR